MFSVEMSSSSSSISTPSTGSDSSSESAGKRSSRSEKKTKSTKPNKNDKGRFEEIPLKQENTLVKTKKSDTEKKRDRENEKLAKAEKRSRKSKKPEGSPISTLTASRSSQFSDDETKMILFSLFKGKNDKEATDDFFTALKHSSRTKAAVKSKVAKTREELSNQINGISEKDLERNG